VLPCLAGKPIIHSEEIAVTYRIRSALSLIAALLLSTSAHAQLFRAYLAPDGNDANPCTLQQPCRLLARRAHRRRQWRRDLDARFRELQHRPGQRHQVGDDPGGARRPGQRGGHGGGNAINIATAGVKVALRNLVIVPLPGGGGLSGVNMTAGAGLTVENCLIANLAANRRCRVCRGARARHGLDVSRQLQCHESRGRRTCDHHAGHDDRQFPVRSPGVREYREHDHRGRHHQLDHRGGLFGVHGWSTNATGVVKVSVSDSLILENSLTGMLRTPPRSLGHVLGQQQHRFEQPAPAWPRIPTARRCGRAETR
jgi:hypothetical protein